MYTGTGEVYGVSFFLTHDVDNVLMAPSIANIVSLQPLPIETVAAAVSAILLI